MAGDPASCERSKGGAGAHGPIRLRALHLARGRRCGPLHSSGACSNQSFGRSSVSWKGLWVDACASLGLGVGSPLGLLMRGVAHGVQRRSFKVSGLQAKHALLGMKGAQPSVTNGCLGCCCRGAAPHSRRRAARSRRS